MLLAAMTATSATPSLAQDLKAVPRERTLILQGCDFHNQVPCPDTFYPYAGVLLHARNSLHSTLDESLFNTNHNTNELIRWITESFHYNDDLTGLTVNLREGVTWADGQKLTAEDVAFTFAMLKAEAPGMMFSSASDEWVDSATAADPLTARAMPQLFASNQIDIARPIQAGSYDAIRFQNPALISWNKEGPHCGSPYDPRQTLEHFHSKYAAPKGEAVKNQRALTRHANPEFDALIDQTEAMQPSPSDAAYMDLVKQATVSFLRDLPEISLAEEQHMLVSNSTDRTGWPSAERSQCCTVSALGRLCPGSASA